MIRLTPGESIDPEMLKDLRTEWKHKITKRAQPTVLALIDEVERLRHELLCRQADYLGLGQAYNELAQRYHGRRLS
jgi:signal transduction histidine kinase